MEEDIFIQIGNKIKNSRREKNITVQELANKAEVSKGFISQIENSRTIPSLMVLFTIEARDISSKQSQTLSTDEHGKFMFSGLTIGSSYSFTFSYIGYDSQK